MGQSKQNSPWKKVYGSISQSWDVRKPLIEEMQNHFSAKVITLFTSFNQVESILSDSDAEMLESILSDEFGEDDEKLLLVLNSPGGDALAAERIANVCRCYSNNNFEVLIPHMAKSAATMICFAASKLHMSDTAELGPVDPQIPYVDDHERVLWISGDEYVRSYEKLIEDASSGNVQRIEPFMQQLVRYDSREIEKIKSAQRLSKTMSIRLLKTGMLSGKTDAEIEESIKVFLVQEETASHGRMINCVEAEECGLKIAKIPIKTGIWKIIWELHLSSDYVVSNRCGKILETAQSSYSCSSSR